MWVRVSEQAWAFCINPQIYWAAASNTQRHECYDVHVFLGNTQGSWNSVMHSESQLFAHDYLGWLLLVLPSAHFSNPLSVPLSGRIAKVSW